MKNSKGRKINMEEGLFTCYLTEYALRVQDQAAVNRGTWHVTGELLLMLRH